MWQLVPGSLRDGGATRELLGALQRRGAVLFRVHQLGHQHQLFSPQRTV